MCWIKNLLNSPPKKRDEKKKVDVTITSPDKDGVAYICVNGLITDTPVVVFPPEMTEVIHGIIADLTENF